MLVYTHIDLYFVMRYFGTHTDTQIKYPEMKTHSMFSFLKIWVSHVVFFWLHVQSSTGNHDHVRIIIWLCLDVFSVLCWKRCARSHLCFFPRFKYYILAVWWKKTKPFNDEWGKNYHFHFMFRMLLNDKEMAIHTVAFITKMITIIKNDFGYFVSLFFILFFCRLIFFLVCQT